VSEFDYPRAGQGGDPRLAGVVEKLLEGAAKAGVPTWKLGPSLVLGFFRFFRRLPNRVLDKTQVSGLYSLLGSGTAPLKMSKADAAYRSRPGPGGKQKCANCSSAYTQVVTGDSICSQVAGEIKPGHWCRLWNTDRN
jgi:hypothetical protein